MKFPIRNLVLVLTSLASLQPAVAQQRQQNQAHTQWGPQTQMPDRSPGFAISNICTPQELPAQALQPERVIPLARAIQECMAQNPELDDLRAAHDAVRSLGQFGVVSAPCQPVSPLEATWNQCLGSKAFTLDEQTLRNGLISTLLFIDPPAGLGARRAYSHLLALSILLAAR